MSESSQLSPQMTVISWLLGDFIVTSPSSQLLWPNDGHLRAIMKRMKDNHILVPRSNTWDHLQCKSGITYNMFATAETDVYIIFFWILTINNISILCLLHNFLKTSLAPYSLICPDTKQIRKSLSFTYFYTLDYESCFYTSWKLKIKNK